MSDGMILLQMPDIARALHMMTKSSFDFKIISGDLSFNLGGTFKALNATYQCARGYFNF